MKKTAGLTFIYPFWGKIVGSIIIFIGIIIFLHRIIEYDIFDLSGGSFPVAIGLMMIFFSKEKDYDERIAYLKFKSLAAAVPVAGMITVLINYLENFNGYSIGTDSWYSISAFEYLTITMAIAIGWFHILKYKE